MWRKFSISIPATAVRWTAVLLILVAGSLPYLLWRHDAIFLSLIAEWLPKVPALPQTPLSEWLIYSFPDGAWYAALLTAIGPGHRSTRPQRAMHALLLSLPFISEGLQYLRLTPGTADIADILTYSIVLITYLIIMRKLRLSKALLCQCILLVAFAAIAMASNSSKSYQESYEDGYRVGSALREALSETSPNVMDSDSLLIMTGAELASN